MSTQKHDYGLDWIDEDQLYEVTKHAFKNAISKAKSAALQAPPDPFTIVTQAVLFNQSAKSMMAFEKLRGVNKTISNAVGNWHQAVLGLADGWENLGSTGGGVDLKVIKDDPVHPISVEVKNRYNTIKSSDEKDMWDKLDLLAKANESVSYLVQIVPKTPERYDRPWNVSGRTPNQRVRCCDGATAYTWAFGKENALEELYEVFPTILSEIIDSNFNDAQGFNQYFMISMPE